MNKITSIIIGIIVIGSTFYFVNKYPAPTLEISEQKKSISTDGVVENTEIKDDGVQYITITARGGYFPRNSNAKAGVPTKLIIKTNGTFDCSTALVIRSLNYRQILQNTGETIIDAGIPKAGEKLQGVCSMGMYNFSIVFK